LRAAAPSAPPVEKCSRRIRAATHDRVMQHFANAVIE
jgi:hypothetical protein